MPDLHLPVHPSLEELEHEAGALVRDGVDLPAAKRELAQSYGAPDWARLVLACRLVDAIWADDLDTLRSLMLEHPYLLHEDALVRKSNWGRPMSYAANLGRDHIITFLHELGATDHLFALDRAALQGQVTTARMLHELAGRPRPDGDALGGPAYTLSVSGTALMLELGAPVADAAGHCLAPVDTVLQSDSRNPAAKHQILEMYAQHGCQLPDTPTMALHRGRIDLLEEHLRRDPGLLRRSFSYEEIFPPSLGCHDEQLPRTTLAGATLLHICVEFDEYEITRWLLDHGMKADAPAAMDADGFGGHTPLFGTVVCFANFWGNYRGGLTDAPFTRLLLDRGADPNARASLREKVQVNGRWTITEHRDLTPLGWGQVFGYQMVVSEPAMRLIADRHGHE